MEEKIKQLEERVGNLEHSIKESLASQQQMAELLKQLINRSAENFSEINAMLGEFDKKLSGIKN